MSCWLKFLILWKLIKSELLLFLFLLLGTYLLLAFPCSLPATFLHDCQQYGDCKNLQLPLPSFQKFMKDISHPCREDLSVSKQESEEVKYSGKNSSFPSSSQICSTPLLVLLQDAFSKENSPFSIAARASCSLREEDTKGGQNRGQAMASLTLSQESTAGW